jgi:hypothetical protein
MYMETMFATFVEGINSFVIVAMVYGWSKGHIHCPCIDCKNENEIKNIEQIRFHLIIRGFMINYKVWNKHGEQGENFPKETI